MTSTLSRVLCLAILLLSNALFARAGTFKQIRFQGVLYSVYELDLPAPGLQFLWKDNQGKPLASFNKARAHLATKGETMSFAMNGGIYEKNLDPTGLLMHNGIELQPLNLERGNGNFFLKPNGVFYIDKSNQAAILLSEDFAKLDLQNIEQAIQSGPLLLQKGQVHPAFKAGSSSRRIRNGVGVVSKNRIVFVISESPVNLYDFSLMFKERLNCQNALYLDGVISKMYHKELPAPGPSVDFSVIITDTRTRPIAPVQAGTFRYRRVFRQDTLSYAKISASAYQFGLHPTAQFPKSRSNGSEYFWSLLRKMTRAGQYPKLMLPLQGEGRSGTVLVQDGQEISKANSGQWANGAVFFAAENGESGLLSIQAYNEQKAPFNTMKFAVVCGPMLLDRGALTSAATAQSNHYCGMGYNEKEKVWVMASTDVFGPMKLSDFAEFFKQQGCNRAVLLGRGDDAAMVIRSVKAAYNRILDDGIPLLISAHSNQQP